MYSYHSVIASTTKYWLTLYVPSLLSADEAIEYTLKGGYQRLSHSNQLLIYLYIYIYIYIYIYLQVKLV